MADELRAHLGAVKHEFATAHAGLEAATAGLGASGVLHGVRASWERQFAAVAGECEELADAMRAVAEGQGENEAAVGASFARLGECG